MPICLQSLPLPPYSAVPAKHEQRERWYQRPIVEVGAVVIAVLDTAGDSANLEVHRRELHEDAAGDGAAADGGDRVIVELQNAGKSA
jgi:hypothetical protein